MSQKIKNNQIKFIEIVNSIIHEENKQKLKKLKN